MGDRIVETMAIPRLLPWRRLALLLGAIGAAVVLTSGCRPAPTPPSRALAPMAAKVDETARWRAQPIGAPITNPPWIAHVTVADVDADGRMDVLACESKDNLVIWIRQLPDGTFEEKVAAAGLPAPVHVEPADLDGDGDVDLLVSVMGFVFPNNDRIGAVVVLENDGRQNFTVRTLLENTARVTDVRAADFNGDGRLDLAVGQFGYDQGEVRWMEQTAPWEFRSHELLNLSGAINVCLADFNGDTHLDIACLISQQWEEIYVFENNGAGHFTTRRIWGSTNEDFGSSGLSICDLNRDGRPDLLYTNGDGFGPSAVPGPRPWHGVQWLENLGNGFFRYQRIAELPNAYSPIGVDLDRDGAMDIIAVSAYADWDQKNPTLPSLVWYRNDGKLHFSPHILAHTPKDLITAAVADFDGDGTPQLVTGGFYFAAPYVRMGRVTLWQHLSP